MSLIPKSCIGFDTELSSPSHLKASSHEIVLTLIFHLDLSGCCLLGDLPTKHFQAILLSATLNRRSTIIDFMYFTALTISSDLHHREFLIAQSLQQLIPSLLDPHIPLCTSLSVSLQIYNGVILEYLSLVRMLTQSHAGNTNVTLTHLHCLEQIRYVQYLIITCQFFLEMKISKNIQKNTYPVCLA